MYHWSIGTLSFYLLSRQIGSDETFCQGFERNGAYLDCPCKGFSELSSGKLMAGSFNKA